MVSPLNPRATNARLLLLLLRQLPARLPLLLAVQKALLAVQARWRLGWQRERLQEVAEVATAQALLAEVVPPETLVTEAAAEVATAQALLAEVVPPETLVTEAAAEVVGWR